jgi:VCBS repeat-containing protein
VAVGDSYSVAHDQPLFADAGTGVLANDSDADGVDALTASLASGVSHGTLTLNADGSFNYNPTAGYSGSDSFTFTASTGGLTSNTATVSLTVNETAPVANDNNYAVNEGQALTVAPTDGVLSNATDAETDALSARVVTQPGHGAVAMNSSGGFVYTPDQGFYGDDSFTYQASDGLNSSNTATVSITVNQIISTGAGSSPAVATGDFNSDGNPDVVLVDQGLNRVVIYLDSSSGVLGSGTAYTVGSAPDAVAVGDFNGDGKLDLAVANSGSNTLSILLGNGDGTFGSPSSVSVGTSPSAVVAADFNGDGKLDLAVANAGSNNLSILLGYGDGTFAAPSNITVGTSPAALALADFNRGQQARPGGRQQRFGDGEHPAGQRRWHLRLAKQHQRRHQSALGCGGGLQPGWTGGPGGCQQRVEQRVGAIGLWGWHLPGEDGLRRGQQSGQRYRWGLRGHWVARPFGCL